MTAFFGFQRISPGVIPRRAESRLNRFAKPLLSAALLTAAGGSLLSAGSAKAGLFNWDELFPASGAPGVCNGATLDPRCIKGDKTVSNFASNFIPATLPTDTTATTVNFNELFGIWDLNVSFAPDSSVGGPYSMSYDLTITDPNKVFDEIGLDSTCNISLIGPCTVTKELAPYVNNVLGPVLAPLTRVSTNGGPAAPESIPLAVQKIRVTDTWITSGVGSLDSVSNNFTQKDAPPVPGPLPLVGAAAAFGWSRRLRNRIKLAD